MVAKPYRPSRLAEQVAAIAKRVEQVRSGALLDDVPTMQRLHEAGDAWLNRAIVFQERNIPRFCRLDAYPDIGPCAGAVAASVVRLHGRPTTMVSDNSTELPRERRAGLSGRDRRRLALHRT